MTIVFLLYNYVNDQPINNPKDKGDALSNHFISMFTKEDLSKAPNIEDAEITIPNISPIIFTQSGIQHLLSTLDVSKLKLVVLIRSLLTY